MRSCLFTILVAVLILTACNGAAQVLDETPVAPASAGGSAGDTGFVPPTATIALEATDQPEEATSLPAASTPTVDAGEPVAEPTATAAPQPTSTPIPTPTSQPTATPVAAQEAEPTATPVATAGAVATPAETPAALPAVLPPAPQSVQPAAVSRNPIAGALELTRVEDTDPGPPIAIEVSAIRVLQNGYIRLTGTVRNVGGEAYGGISVIATFYDKEQSCHMGIDRQGHTIKVCDPTWHGPVEVYAACSYLQPGAACPFSLEIYPGDYGSYHLHPEGAPLTYRQPASITVANLRVTNDGFGYLHITGTANNPNPFPVANARIAGALFDGGGKILSVGSVPILGQIPAGGNAPFELRIEYQSYATFQLYPEAVQG
jgi:hypothetical protein